MGDSCVRSESSSWLRLNAEWPRVVFCHVGELPSSGPFARKVAVVRFCAGWMGIDWADSKLSTKAQIMLRPLNILIPVASERGKTICKMPALKMHVWQSHKDLNKDTENKLLSVSPIHWKSEKHLEFNPCKKNRCAIAGSTSTNSSPPIKISLKENKTGELSFPKVHYS